MSVIHLLVVAAGVILAWLVRGIIFYKWPAAFWRDLAAATHLTYFPRGVIGDPYLAGNFRHYPLTIDNFTNYVRGGPREFVRMRVEVSNPDGIQFTLGEAGRHPPAPWKPTQQRVLLGDPDFDQRFNLVTQSGASVATCFPPAVRRRWLRLRPFDLQLSGNTLQFRHISLDLELAESVFVLNLVIDLAHSIDQDQTKA